MSAEFLTLLDVRLPPLGEKERELVKRQEEPRPEGVCLVRVKVLRGWCLVVLPATSVHI